MGTVRAMDADTAPERLRTLPTWLLSQAALLGQRIGADALAALGAHRSHYAVSTPATWSNCWPF